MKLRTTLLTLTLFTIPLSAQAEIRIRNLDKKPVKIVVTEMGKTDGILLPADGTYTITSPSVIIALPGQKPKRADNFEEFSVKGGELYLSRRTDRGGHH
ncbi:MAG: hypothetical protein EB060_02410 [Proteobacteria bacterium]|nr:hypothetical protein [Pseudomonadota bacterium]